MLWHSEEIWNEAKNANTEPIWRGDADILSEAIGSRIVAEAWIARFGNLAGVVATNRSVLYVIAKGADPTCAYAALDRLLAIHRYGFRALAQRATKRPLLGDLDRTIAYLRIAMQSEGTVQFRILFLDAQSYLIHDEVMQRGTVDHMQMYPREVMRRALEVHAASIVIVHNHPWGDPVPLPFEIECSRQIIAAGKPLGISIHDHIIVGRNGAASLLELGILDECRGQAAAPIARRRIAARKRAGS